MLAPEGVLLHERPCRPGRVVLPRPPPRNTLRYVMIQLGFRPLPDPSEVSPCSADVAVELPDFFFEAQRGPPCPPAELVVYAVARLPRHIQPHSSVPPSDLVSEESKAVRRVRHASFLRMKREPQAAQQGLDPGQFAIRSASCEHDEVSRPGESHPRALAEPYVNLSAHTAPLIQPQVEFPADPSERRASDHGAQCVRSSTRLAGDGASTSYGFASFARFLPIFG